MAEQDYAEQQDTLLPEAEEAPETPPVDEEPGEQQEPGPIPYKRFSQVNRQKNEEREARIRAEERAALLERQLQHQTQYVDPRHEAPQAPAQPAARPDRDDYDDEDAYVEALVDWTTEARLVQRDQERESRAREREQATRIETEQQRIDASVETARQQYPDFATRIREADQQHLAPQHVQAAVQQSGDPGGVAYYLATHLEELAALNAETDPRRVVATIVAIEDTMRADRASAAADEAGTPAPEAEQPETEQPQTAPPVRRGLPPLTGAPDAETSNYDPYREQAAGRKIDQVKFREYIERTEGRPRYG